MTSLAGFPTVAALYSSENEMADSTCTWLASRNDFQHWLAQPFQSKNRKSSSGQGTLERDSRKRYDGLLDAETFHTLKEQGRFDHWGGERHRPGSRDAICRRGGGCCRCRCQCGRRPGDRESHSREGRTG